MNLSKILSNINVLKRYNESTDIDIIDITEDSRKVSVGSIFVAINGDKTDGHKYINQAVERGASVIVYQNEIELKEEKSVIYIKVKDTHKALSLMSCNFYDNPSKKLKLVGVTGTNGKTTIATLLYKIHCSAGFNVGLISTVCNYICEKELPSTYTTPAPMMLNYLLSEMVNNGCTYAFMEVSSHAADQDRIFGLDFDGAIFTNLTRDHLDYHKTVDNYLLSKKKFFDNLKSDAFALTNIDEKTAMVMLQNTRASKYTYAINTIADFTARILENHIDSTLITINDVELIVRLIGKFNIYNLLAVYSASVLLGMDKEYALQLLSHLMPVSGRFQTFVSPKRGYTAIVDYAHTPDALENVITAIRNLIGDKNIITVVGCGGDRDPGKRPMMAKVSLQLSNKVILTSDNPRTEDPDKIIEDMKFGLSEDLLCRAISITNRREAIKVACSLAHSGDIVLIAGKGHETYQEIMGVKYDFDDREEVQRVFETEGK